MSININEIFQQNFSEKGEKLLEDIFTPEALVLKERPAEMDANFWQQFEKACQLYENRQYGKAVTAFESLLTREESKKWLPLIVCHAAEASIRLKNFELAHKLFSKLDKLHPLEGGFLWNYGYSSWKLGYYEEARHLLQRWLGKVASDVEILTKGRVEMIIACLLHKSGRPGEAHEYLERSVVNNPELEKYLVERPSNKNIPPPKMQAVNEPKPALARELNVSKEVEAALIQILVPKRPERGPALSQNLSTDEREQYSQALEWMADGENDKALDVLIKLQKKYPENRLLDVSVASARIFSGEYEAARDGFLHLQESGHKLTGSAWWNLACTQVRLKDYEGVYEALDACSHTEYKSSPQVWKALKALRGETEPVPIVKIEKEMPEKVSNPLLHELPKGLEERRLLILSRLLAPKKMPRDFKPDIGRLPQREIQNMVITLESAFKAPPSEAVEILKAVYNQNQDLYTIRAHLAANLILNGDLQKAREIYLWMDNVRTLDITSRNNFAYSFLREKKLNRVVQVLEKDSDAIKEYAFWLALALARAMSEMGDAAQAAARALASVKNNPSENTVIEVLKIAEIPIPAKITLVNPNIAIAEEALAKLEEEDWIRAREILEANGKYSAERIPEIGRIVMEPVFLYRPGEGRIWKEEVTSLFNASLREFENGQYAEAASNFSSLYKSSKIPGMAINASAGYIKAGNPTRAITSARNALNELKGKSWRLIKPLGWRLVYNCALAELESEGVSVAIKTIELDRNTQGHKPKKLTGLLAAICLARLEDENLLGLLASSLDELQKLVYKPSDDLILANAWVQLNLREPDFDLVKSLLRRLAQPNTNELSPPAEIKSMLEIRKAYKTLTDSGETEKAVDYMETIIETRSGERQAKLLLDLSKFQVEQSIGLEFIARICRVQALNILIRRQEAIEEVAEIGNLLKDNEQLLAPGFVVQNWRELAQTSENLGLVIAALQYAESGLKIDPENSDLLAYRKKLQESLQVQEKDNLLKSLIQLDEIIRSKGSNTEIRKLAEVIKPHAPNLIEAFNMLIGIMDEESDPSRNEELVDQVSLYSRMELPKEESRKMEQLLDWIIVDKGWDSLRLPVEIEVHGDRIWPSLENHQQGACLLTFSSKHRIEDLTLKDPTNEKEIWRGQLLPDAIQYKRYEFYREDGFSSRIRLDFPLHFYIQDASGKRSIPAAVTASIGLNEPVWPSYPTGALSPEDLDGADLYGRAPLINRIIKSLSRNRAQATFFLQGPRQMGKTSLLYFVKSQAPPHVLPVYINLEKPWSQKEPGNIWNYLVTRVLEESKSPMQPGADTGNNETSLISTVAKACERLKKDYVLFLIDELHALFLNFNPTSSAGGILASFRDFLNNRDNKITLLLSDRYTMVELERQCPSEYWAQLSLLNVGPLDFENTKRAIELPTRATDITFLPETIDKLYQVTGGYPYHLQRAAQDILETMYAGPWVTALPEDVDQIIPKFLQQDRHFQEGLCRPDRIDDELAEAISALLEWLDLQELLPSLASENKDWDESLKRWKPDILSFLAHMQNPERIIRRLRDIGVMKENDEAFFSPLLQMWLQKMRRQGLGLQAGNNAKWQIASDHDGSTLTARDWQNLDSELIKRASYKGKPPLKEQATRIDEWEIITRKVSSEVEFGMFIDAIFRLIIDKREEKSSIQKYPWLFLTYHRLRLIRNWVVHESDSLAAQSAWNDVCRRAIGGDKSAYLPATPDEWKSVQVTLLRYLYTGLHNALELAGKPE